LLFYSPLTSIYLHFTGYRMNHETMRILDLRMFQNSVKQISDSGLIVIVIVV